MRQLRSAFTITNADTLNTFIVSHLEQYPPVESAHDVLKQRIFTAFLAYLPSTLLEPLTDQLVVYLSAVFIQTHDCYTQLYAMMTLEELNAQEAIAQNENIQILLERFKGQFPARNEMAITRRPHLRMTIQLRRSQCAHALSAKQPNDAKKGPNEKDVLPFQLNPNDATKHLQLSRSKRMARNTNRNQPQTVRSNFAINCQSGAFYFEVTILTVGQLRIGLADKLMNIKEAIGSNEHSIGFDGRSVWCGGKQMSHRTLPRWEIGDIIGCYIDSSERLIKFAINDKIIFELEEKQHKKQLHFIWQGKTHIALTLFPHQQCYINLNCTSIPSVYLRSSIIEKSHENDWNAISVFKNATMKNSIIRARGITIVHQQSNRLDASRRQPSNRLQSCTFCSTQTHDYQFCQKCQRALTFCLSCVSTSILQSGCPQCSNGNIESRQSTSFSSASITFASRYLNEENSIPTERKAHCQRCQIPTYTFRSCNKCSFKARSCHHCASCLLSCPNCTAQMPPAQKTFQIPLVASIPLYSGVYYFEALLHSCGRMQFGWTTRLSAFNRITGTAERTHSAVISSDYFEAGDTIGCLVDIERKLVYFYNNGRQNNIVAVSVELFNHLPLFPLAILGTRQLVDFNFGHKKFKHPPPPTLVNKCSYRSLLTAAQKAGFQCAIMEPKAEANTNEWRIEYHKLLLDEVLCFPCNEKQKAINQWVRVLEDDIIQKRNIPINREDIALHLKDSCSNDDEYTALQYLHALVEVVGGDEPKSGRIDVLAYWIGYIVSSLRQLHSNCITSYLTNLFKCNNNNNHFQSQKIVKHHRHLCIILANISATESAQLKAINQVIITYLNEVILRSADDHWTQLYSLVALINMVQLFEVKEFKVNEELVEKWFKFETTTKVDSSTAVDFQLHLCSNVFQKLGTVNLPADDADDDDDFVLDEVNKSPHLQLSPSQLMARTDHHHTSESIRSKCPINHQGTAYFEVTLCTSGPMRIGLASRRMNSENIKEVLVGSYEDSIAFDGYHCCLWKGGQKYSVCEQLAQWQVGDTVGWYVNRPEKEVMLAHNGKIITFDDSLVPEKLFSRQFWYAAVSLGAHQQCHFNFVCPTPAIFSPSAAQQAVNIGTVQGDFVSQENCVSVTNGKMKTTGDMNLTSKRVHYNKQQML